MGEGIGWDAESARSWLFSWKFTGLEKFYITLHYLMVVYLHINTVSSKFLMIVNIVLKLICKRIILLLYLYAEMYTSNFYYNH